MASQESIESNERGSSSLVIDNDDASSVKSFSSVSLLIVQCVAGLSGVDYPILDRA